MLGYDGQMKVVSLLPENAVLSAVPALTVCGKTLTAPHAKKPSSTAFRTEIRPRGPAETDTFLTVMGVGKAGRPLAFAAKTIPGGKTVGAAFKGHAVYFSADARLITDAFELAVPEGITDVADRALDDLPGLKRVIFPDSTEYIGREAALHCGELLSVSVPNSAFIEEGAFLPSVIIEERGLCLEFGPALTISH